MTAWRQVVAVTVLLAQARFACADETITNFMSPILSYQYSEDLTDSVLTNGGVASASASYQFPQELDSEANGNVSTPVVSYRYVQEIRNEIITNGGIASFVLSYEYPRSLDLEILTNGNIVSPMISYQHWDNLDRAVLTNGGVISPISSYRYYDWPGDDILKLKSSRVVSYYYQLNSTGPSALVHGRITDLNGVPLAGVSISAMVFLTPVAQAVTDVNGNYQLPALGGAVYDLWAVRSGYQTSIRAFTLALNTTEQNFQLKQMPGPPVTRQTDRLPDLSSTISLMGSVLRVFDGTQFQPITLENAPSPNRMTIVLTHGWNSDPNVWARGMASEMRNKGVMAEIANIVAWDWHSAAAGISPPEEHTPSQGIALGQALFGVLGPTYSQPLHFIGHSLGALVNAAAANYLHGDRTAQQDISPVPWAVPVHMTMLDEAEAASALGLPPRLFNGIIIQLNPSAALPSSSDTSIWKSPTPMHLTWADNYRSEFGWYQLDAANVILLPLGDPIDMHAYAYQWYMTTIAHPNDCILGFRQSEEAKLANVSAFSYSEAGTEFPPGVLYVQPFFLISPLTLVHVPSINQVFGTVAQNVVQGANGVIETVGNVVIQLNSAAQTANELLSQGFSYVDSLAGEGRQGTVNLLNSAVLHLTLTTGASRPPMRGNGFDIPPGRNDGDTNSISLPMIWLPLQIPTGATFMAFDFAVSGDPSDDSLVCGIGTNNLFSLQAKYIPTNTFSASRLLDVTLWAGTTNELFFGFLGGYSSNATLEIDNIRFYSLLPPAVHILTAGPEVVVSWPISANGYVLETTENLTVSNFWTVVTNVPVPVVDQLFVTNGISANSQYFRLRQ